MKAKIRKYLRGYLKIRIIGYSPERFLNLCSHQNIDLWNLSVNENAYEMNILVRDFRKLKPILRKTGTKVKVVERSGFPFFVQKYKTRQFFVAGFLMCMTFLFFMSAFIWRIDVCGNARRSDEEIRRFLREAGVYEGRFKKEVNCEEIVRILRAGYEDVIWVSASVDGVQLQIHIKENTDRVYEDEEESISGPVDIIAEKDGVITEMITSRGVPQVKIGDVVKKGDVLVSGTMEIYNDAMEVVNYQYCVSEAEIKAETEYSYEEDIERGYTILSPTGRKQFRFWLENKKKRIVIGKKKSGYKYDRRKEEEKRLWLGASMCFPIRIGYEIIEECKMEPQKYSDEEMRWKLSENYQRFCQDLKKKGVQILENGVKIYCGIARTSARGNLKLEEPIGRKVSAERQIEEIN